MLAKIRAIYDGEKIVLEEPLDLAPGTEVVLRISSIVERESPADSDSTGGDSSTESGDPEYDDERQRYLFFRTARRLAKEMPIDLPPDFSRRLDDYLYGDLSLDDYFDRKRDEDE